MTYSCVTSLPTRECGLKSALRGQINNYGVTPYAGVWIEIFIVNAYSQHFYVTPYAGVWIEISVSFVTFSVVTVTPYAGVWIEIIVL